MKKIKILNVSLLNCREGNDPDDCSKMTYKQLLDETCKFANVLKSKGKLRIDHASSSRSFGSYQRNTLMP